MEVQLIQNRIYEIRGIRVMLDFDLAELYQVETKRLKEAVRRNIARFEGDDFMFELTLDERNRLENSLRSQFATSNLIFQNGISSERGGRRYMPFAFTEFGVAMLSSVLRSEKAIIVNRSIMEKTLLRWSTICRKTSAKRLIIFTKLSLLFRSKFQNYQSLGTP